MRIREDVIAKLRDYGLKVFPLRDKRPALHLSTWKEIDENVPMGTPFGVALGGINNIYVIDPDDSRLIPYFQHIIEKTYSVKTGKGAHIYILGGKSSPEITHVDTQYGHIDLVSRGGYVIGETSDHYNKKKNADGKDEYYLSGKIYEKFPDSPLEINYIDPKEIGKIFDKIGVQHSKDNPINIKKEPMHERLGNAIENGVKEGNRNNELFAIACNNLKLPDVSPETAYDMISFINQQSQEPLSKTEVDQLFQSATETVQKEIEENQKKSKKSKDEDKKSVVTFERIYKEPQTVHAVTLDEDNNAFILVYLPSKKTITKDDVMETTFPALAHFIKKGADGNKTCFRITDKTKLSPQDYIVGNLFTEFSQLKGKWTNQDVDTWIDSNSKVDVKALFEDMLELIKKYFEMQFEFDYYFEIVWILHTYFYTLFQYTPYIDLVGDKGVGKSKNITFLKQLSYNGYSSGDASVSTIFRTVQGTGCSLFLDETEDMQGGDKKDDQKDKQNLLRNGFHIDGTVSRADTKSNNFMPITFGVFSPKGMAHINSFDEVLADRTLPLNIIASDKPHIVKAHPNNDPTELYDCRRRCFELFLDFAVEVKELIPEAESIIESHNVHGRNMDLWLSQITTALFLDKHGVKDVLDKIIAKMEHVTNNKTNDNMEDNLSFRILQIVDNHIDELPRYATPLYKFINEKYEEAGFDKLRPKDIRTCLERLGFHQGVKETPGIPWINFTPERVHDIKVRKGLVKPTQITLADTDSTPKKDDDVDNVGNVA